MEKEKNNQKQKENEICPHCKVSDETLEILRQAGKDKKDKENKEDN
ncbi:MAG: hypothetical protein KJI70_01325 [Patescibacteria group bacterium]|nr:hypothetical protein [Patescibacteria group bacterium]